MTRLPVPIATGELAPFVGGAFVYRIFDRDDQLLYIGMTEALMARLAEHRLASSWYFQALRIEWDEYRDRDEAAEVERVQIRLRRPLHNVTYNDDRLYAARFGHQRRYAAEDWTRLGAQVRSSRMAMRRSQTSIARDAGIAVDVLRRIEAGHPEEYQPVDLSGIEYGLSWAPGSLESVLAGGEPMRLTAEERAERAHLAYDSISVR